MANVISEHLSQEVASDIKVLLRDLRKILKVLTIYPDDNPLPTKMRQSFGSQFTEMVEEYSGFVFMIRPNDIIYNRESVFQDESKEEALAALFYNAGIIQLEFREGLPQPEFNAFLDLLRTYLNDRSQDCDLVTMMWQEQFSHIKFKTVEDLALNEYRTEVMIREMFSDFGAFENSAIDVDQIAQAADEAEAKDGTALGNASNSPEILEDARRMGLSLEVKTDEAQETINQLFSSSYTPAEEEMREIGQLLEESRRFDPDRTATRIVVDILNFWDEPEPFAEAVTICQGILDQLLTKGNFTIAANLIHTIHGLRQELGESRPVHAEHLKHFIYTVSDDSYIQKLTDVVNRQEIVDRNALEIYLEALGQESLMAITGMLGHLVSQEARLTVCDFLARVGKGSINIIASGVNDQCWYVVRNTVMILGRIGGPEVIPYLSEAARHPDQRVRREVMQALTGDNSNTAIDMMFEFLKDPVPALRQKALSHLKKAGGSRSYEIIKSLVHSPDFPNYPLDEQERCLIVYSTLGNSEAAGFLGAIAGSFCLFKIGWKARYRCMALKALAYNTSEEAEKLILEYTRSRRAWLRKLATTALEQRRRLMYGDKESDD